MGFCANLHQIRYNVMQILCTTRKSINVSRSQPTPHCSSITQTVVTNAMATAHAYLAQLGRSCLSSSLRARPQLPVSFLFPATQLRYASAKSVGTKGQNPQKNKKKGEAPKKKKKARTSYKQYDDKDAESFYLLDAMRYVGASVRSVFSGTDDRVDIYELLRLDDHRPQ